jgi:FkbM family methyltransferase
MIEIGDCRYGAMMYLANDKWLGRSFGHYGEALESEISLISHFVKPGDVVIDGGANMGTITMPMALMVGEEGHVHAFEPQEFVRYTLCGNVALNNLYNVTVYDRPLGSTDDKILYCVNKELKNDDGVYFYDEEGQHFGGLELIEERRFDNDVALKTISIDSLDLQRLDFMKLDVEGAEVAALKGAVKTIEKHQPIMILESMPWDAPKIVEYIRSIGYVHQAVRLKYFNPENWNGVEEDVLRDECNPKAPMMSSDMICYPASRRNELDMVFFKAMKELV